VSFGLGIAMTAFSHMGWGWLGWGLNWLAHTVLFNQSDYYSQSGTVADWGLPYGGPRAFSQGRGLGAQGGSYRTPVGYGLSNGRYNETPAQGFLRTPYRYPYGGNRPAEYGRGYQAPLGGGYGRSAQEAYNRVPSAPGRPQQYGGSSYGSSFYSRPGENYGSRPGGYGNTTQTYRGSAAGLQRGDFGRRSSSATTGMGFAQSSGKQAHSGGFHLFGGGGHAPKGFNGGKGFGGGRGFGGGKSFSGHSGGGGHGGGHGGGKHH
jgi:hypothetical protein